jgi:3-hydroxyisobutyrate dehydrogenase
LFFLKHVMEKIGFIGLGNMGQPMAQNLLKAGFPLSVYNRSANKTAAFRGAAAVCSSVGELVHNSGVVFTMLTNDEAVKEVYAAILETDVAGRLFVDMSTISPQLSLEICGQLKAKGASLLDAPVAGSTQPAANGTLIILAGGETTDLERARPYLEKMGRLIRHFGGNGKGLAAKLSVNYYLSVLYQSLAETVLLSQQLGLNRADLLEVINESAVGSGATRVKTPLLLSENYAPAFALDLMWKDIRLAQEAGADFPLGRAAAESYRRAAAQGFGQDDVIGIIRYLQQGMDQQ